MATVTETTVPDALLILRSAVTSGSPPVLTTSATTTTDTSQITDNVAQATHLQFNHSTSRHVLSLNTETRFEQNGNPVDLRSIFFAWLTKELPVPDYIEGVQKLTQELQSTSTKASAQQLVFAERIDLITWLDGATEETEYIRPLNEEEQAKQAGLAANIARGTADGAPGRADGLSGAGRGRQADPRLREILNGERRMGDRNTILRGIKPTDFSHVRKHAEPFVARSRGKAGANGLSAPAAAAAIASQTPSAGLASRAKPGRRVDPIILVSPSASSLLRMANIKSFLDDGKYVPPEQGGSEANRQTISRMVPSIDPTRPLRFVLVDTPEMFKPEYWSRVAAVFTTGQTWQFKPYKWQSPPDLFAHALGVYVGWSGETPPEAVTSWGRGVAKFAVDKWSSNMPQLSRWRDREVVEGIWTAIEESMRSKGMNRDGQLTGGR